MSAAPVLREEVTAPAASAVPEGPGTRRVRHQARDAVLLMSFSALMSLLFAVVLLLLAGLGR